MKAPQLSYEKASSLADALERLSACKGFAVALAGGQSLLAGLNLRLSSPETLVDISGLSDLRGVEMVERKEVRIGALTRHADLLASPVIRDHVPLLAAAVAHVAHAAIRNRGTIGGSLAYADPAAELPACMVTLGATIVIESCAGRRKIAASDFFQGLFTTDLQPDELIVEVRVPARADDERWAFVELSRRRGDFALAGVAMVARRHDASSRLCDARAAYLGCSGHAALAGRVGAVLCGSDPLDVSMNDLDQAVEADLELTDSRGLRADTKLKLARVVTRRAFRQLAGLDGPGPLGGV